MPIYTRTGDKGQTSLFDGTRVSKSHIRVDTYGTIDELNSIIGTASAHLRKLKTTAIKKELQRIQNDLLDIGSGLAMPDGMPIAGLDKRVKEFEILIDKLTVKMPKLNEFILPGGAIGSSLLHVARTVSRRAERRIVILMKKEEIDESILKYINRLSDLFFTMARYVNFVEGKKDTTWIKK